MSAEAPVTLTLEQALARLRIWTEEPSEEVTQELIDAALDSVRKDSCTARLRLAAQKYHAARREMVRQHSSFGCDVEAEVARADLRESDRIIEVEKVMDQAQDQAPMVMMSCAMLRAGGCHIAAKVKRLGGKWVGFGSCKPCSSCQDDGVCGVCFGSRLTGQPFTRWMESTARDKSGPDAYEAGRAAFAEGHCIPPDDESKHEYWNAGVAAALAEHEGGS